MELTALQYGLGAVSGGAIGFVLALAGGGGSILAVPLMLYLVGVADPHIAVGTSAFAVAANAAVGLANHARRRTVQWRCGLPFAASGVAGAVLGSTLGKAVNGAQLITLFGFLMLGVSGLMLARRGRAVGALGADGRLLRLCGYGAGSGGVAGFFGIGGGFLIVPGLVTATGMPMLQAIGTSLIAVLAFGLTTAANYALSGWVDWPLALTFIVGGVAGCAGGATLAQRLSARDGRLEVLLALVIFAVAIGMIVKSAC